MHSCTAPLGIGCWSAPVLLVAFTRGTLRPDYHTQVEHQPVCTRTSSPAHQHSSAYINDPIIRTGHISFITYASNTLLSPDSIIIPIPMFSQTTCERVRRECTHTHAKQILGTQKVLPQLSFVCARTNTPTLPHTHGELSMLLSLFYPTSKHAPIPPFHVGYTHAHIIPLHTHTTKVFTNHM